MKIGRAVYCVLSALLMLLASIDLSFGKYFLISSVL